MLSFPCGESLERAEAARSNESPLEICHFRPAPERWEGTFPKENHVFGTPIFKFFPGGTFRERFSGLRPTTARKFLRVEAAFFGPP